ncbi:odorant receptor Or2-like isoform X2 [Bactrocera neohumeralis]|nr:odorant receptor Or2-like isoform X2 [Bactrocera tryoni]XP_039952111.1 odorant receptor Or2-like isoform X2 [Bactrocera tryoni]XP_050319852.1 odorant receptor Or2-like isoform X2 [Bactrocera neohumeralis]XP_050319853.1 odorant receptor Or2-like isoform X2 [Bactrocera neohumeralis]
MTNYENLPLYAVNVKVFVKVGLIDSTGYTKGLLFCLIPIITYVGQIMHIFKSWNEDIGETSMNLHILLLKTHCLVRLWLMVKKPKDFERFFQCVEQWYRDIERNGDPQMVDTLQEITKRTQLLSKMTVYVAAGGTIAAFFYPLSFDGRKHMITVQYPLFDVLETPFFEFFFLLQMICLVPIILVLTLQFTNIFLISLMFGELILKDLCVKLRNIRSENEETMLQEFKECIGYHRKVIDLCDDLQDLLSMDSFFHVALFGMMLCLLLFFLSMIHDLRLILTILTFVSYTTYMLFTTYYYANNLATESLEVANAAYDTPWYRGNLEMRKCVITMIARCQKPLQMKAGGLYPMTMETFQAILRVSYSYFSLLQGLNQQ